MRTVKKIALAAVLLSAFAIVCTPAVDTESASVWARPIEPRLTGADGWQRCRKPPRPGRAVREARCGPQPQFPIALPRPRTCDREIHDANDAVKYIAERPACTDLAIAELQFLAATNDALWSDVAAGYFVRAQREDDPVDLLHAMEAADNGLAARPNSPAARFNYALILESLGFRHDAIAAWDDYLAIEASAQWRAEANAHRAVLLAQTIPGIAREWARDKPRLVQAAGAGDRATVRGLVQRYPTAAPLLVEALLLTDGDAASRQLQMASVIAREIAAVTGDPYLVDSVAAMQRGQDSPAVHAALQAAAKSMRAAAQAKDAFDYQNAEPLYAAAVSSYARAGDALRLNAQHSLVAAMGAGKDPVTRTAKLFSEIEAEAQNRGYRRLLQRLYGTAGFTYFFGDRYIDSLDAYDKAASYAASIGDHEALAGTHRSKVGVYRVMGSHDLSWREAIHALRNEPRITSPISSAYLLHEVAITADEAGFPRIGLRYADEAIRVIETAISDAPVDEQEAITRLQLTMAGVRRTRASIALRLGANMRGRDDIREATRLSAGAKTDSVARSIQARIQEVRGQALLHSAPARAVAEYTKAIELVSENEYRTLRANLFLQRAEAQRLAGNAAGTVQDLRRGIELLRQEELVMVANRRRGKSEELLTPYFARFQDSYRLLIAQLIESGRREEAFGYAEKARAFEPLMLIQQNGYAPAAFARVTQSDETTKLASIRKELPDDTYIIQYTVLSDRTYAWIVSRRHFEVLPLKAGTINVERWTEALQEAAQQGKPAAFTAALRAPSDQLVREPLQRVRELDGKQRGQRLVFVPDGAMHGLPFAALYGTAGDRHLIQDGPVSVAPSSSLYVFSLLRGRQLRSAGGASLLLVGDPELDPHSPSGRGMLRLPLALSEVARIHKAYGARAVIRTGKEATVPEFLRLARGKTVVHFAGHSVADPEVPSRSHLLLAPSGSHRGVLNAQELLTQSTFEQTQLVILSSCSSAGGSTVGPEGMAPLVRPLMAAGVPAVIGSLWAVDDATAEELLVSFHRHFLQGRDTAAAMQAAQVQLLTQHKPALAWGSFQVIGQSSSPFALPPQP